jgi:hypothetical protein
MNQGGEFFYAMALLLFFCCSITGAVRRWLKMPTAAKIMQFFFTCRSYGSLLLNLKILLLICRSYGAINHNT